MTSYVSIEGISRSYGVQTLFEDISFGINKGQKIALIAKNGAGKTSLLHIIAGVEKPDIGQVIFRKGLKIGFLDQNPELPEGLSVMQTIFNSKNPVLEVIARYEKSLKNPENTIAYREAFDLMEHYDAWDFEIRYKQILSKLKLDQTELLVKHLSGGQKKRLALAHILIDKPDLLILDEPTNHLDMEMIEWLENFLYKEKVTLLMVTHDRYFLERVCNEIVELDERKIYRYNGNYSYYLNKREERRRQEQARTAREKNLFAKELEWMRRQPQARGSKSKSRIDSFYRLKTSVSQKTSDRKLQLEMNMERLGSKILEFHKVSKSFDDKKIIDRFSYVFKRGERIGIIGKNGTGKSTFLNMITGSENIDSGKIRVGETVKFGYYRQKGIQVKPQQKVLDVVRETADFIPLAKGRKMTAEQLLERFLFSREKQYDYVEKLSGGEKKRLYLCKILMSNPNFLIFDEPTNDLDILSINVLEEFLMDFQGCLLVVSHDRFFIDKTTDHLFVFEGEGVIKDFPGNYSDYKDFEAASKKENATPKKLKNTSNDKNRSHSGLSYKERQEIKLLEKKIARLEAEKQQIENSFAVGENTADTIRELAIKLDAITKEIDVKTARWFELSSIQDNQ